MGGAGTSVPPLDVEVEPLEELDEDELELDEEDDAELDDELDVPPKLDELEVELTLPDEDDELEDDEEEDDDEEVELDTLPEELDVELTLPDDVLEVLLTPPVDVLDVLLTPPVEVEDPPVELVDVLLTPPVEVDDPPEEVDVDPPELDEVLDTPPDVLLTPPVEVDEPPEPPDEVEVDEPPEPPDEVEPPLEVEETTILPPPLPPPKPPTKKPPPKPPPKPPEPPTTTGTPPPPLDRIGPSGRGIGAPPCDATVTVAGAQAWVVTVRVMRFTTRRAGARAAIRLRGAFLTLWDFTYAVLGWLDACIAPPPITAPPQAQAQSFARAIRTDITFFPYPRGEMRLPPGPIHRPFTQSDCRSLEIPASRLTLIIAPPKRFTKGRSQSIWLMSHKGAVSLKSLTRKGVDRALGTLFDSCDAVRQFTAQQSPVRYIDFRVRGGLYAV